MQIAQDGGADRNRTCDLLIANETLYQLSYDPAPITPKISRALRNCKSYFCMKILFRENCVSGYCKLL